MRHPYDDEPVRKPENVSPRKTFDFKFGNSTVKAKLFERGDEKGFTLVKVPMGGTIEVPYVLDKSGNFLVAEKGFGKYFLVFDKSDVLLIERDAFEKDTGMKKAFEKNIFEGYLTSYYSSSGESLMHLSFNGLIQLYNDLGILVYESKFVKKEGGSGTTPIASIRKDGKETQLLLNASLKDKESLITYAGAYLMYDVLEGNLGNGGELSYFGKPELDDVRNKAFVIKWFELEKQYKKAKRDLKYLGKDISNEALAEVMRLPSNVVLELKLLYD